MVTQVEIGIHLNMDQSTVSRMCDALNIDWRMSTIDEVRIAYIRHLRAMAEVRSVDGGVDLATERAGLARAQREKIEMQNAVARRELAPVALLEEILAKAGSRVAGILDAIPGMIERRVAGLSSNDIELIAVEVARARSIAAGVSLDDVGDDPFTAENETGVNDVSEREDLP